MSLNSISNTNLPLPFDVESNQNSSIQSAQRTQNASNVAVSTDVSHAQIQPQKEDHVSSEKVNKAVEELNKRLNDSNTKVVVDNRAPSNHLWLNLVDKATGQVIQEFPPEGIRQFMQTGSISGLAIDKRS